MRTLQESDSFHGGGRSVGVVIISRHELAAVVEAAVARVLDARQRAEPQPAVEWLTVEQAADILGYRASYLRKRPDIPVHKVGRKRRYRRSELEALLMRAGG